MQLRSALGTAVLTVGVALALYGCGKGKGGGKPSPSPKQQCGSADLFLFPTGEPIYLNFKKEECAGNLAAIWTTGALLEAVTAVVADLAAGKEPEVPEVLLTAAKPLCKAQCQENIVDCKLGATGGPCDPAQKKGYVGLFSYICGKEAAVFEMSEAVEAEECPSADLFTFPSEAHPKGEVIFVKFKKEECAKDLALVAVPALAKAVLEVATALLEKKTPVIPEALLTAAKPLCLAKCQDSIADCKVGETAASCDPAQTAFYKQLFAFFCSAEPAMDDAAYVV